MKFEKPTLEEEQKIKSRLGESRHREDVKKVSEGAEFSYIKGETHIEATGEQIEEARKEMESEGGKRPEELLEDIKLTAMNLFDESKKLSDREGELVKSYLDSMGGVKNFKEGGGFPDYLQKDLAAIRERERAISGELNDLLEKREVLMDRAEMDLIKQQI